MPINKTPNLAMNLSPISIIRRNSPKEKRTFTFFRSRTLSSSSTESTGGGGGNGSGGNSYTGGNGPPSPRLSPRTLFDKVRKRSQSDVKSQASVEQVGLNTYQQNLQLHLQQQLQEKLLMQQQELMQQQMLLKRQLQPPGNGLSSSSNGSGSNNNLAVAINGGRKHLNHSISEENDESISNEDLDTSQYKLTHYQSLHHQQQTRQQPIDIMYSMSSPNKLLVWF